GHLRSGSDARFNPAVAGAQIEKIEPTANFHMAIAGLGVERALENIRFNIAIARCQPRFSVQPFRPNLSIGCVDFRARVARSFYIDSHRLTARTKEGPRNVHVDPHVVPDLLVFHPHFTRPDLPPGGSDVDADLVDVSSIDMNVAVS